MNQVCPLCATAGAAWLGEGKTPPRPYYRCAVCQLTFVPRKFFIDAAEEKSRYEEHENHPKDPKYRAFLKPVFDAVIPRVKPGAAGLDYGCGPGPALVEMFREAGYAAEGYDPFFAPRTELLERQYDFVTCSEAAEHFHDPAKELRTLHGLLKPGGCLTVLTQTWNDVTPFLEWYYTRDPTHVSFFHAATFAWLAQAHGWNLAAAEKNLFVLEKITA